MTRPTTKPDTKPGASAPAILQRILEGRPFTIEDADEVMDYVDTLLARREAAETAVSTMRAAINERVSEREAYKAHAEALAAALQVFVERCSLVSDSPDPLYCVHESDVTDAEKQAAVAALAAYREGGAK